MHPIYVTHPTQYERRDLVINCIRDCYKKTITTSQGFHDHTINPLPSNETIDMITKRTSLWPPVSIRSYIKSVFSRFFGEDPNRITQQEVPFPTDFYYHSCNMNNNAVAQQVNQSQLDELINFGSTYGHSKHITEMFINDNQFNIHDQQPDEWYPEIKKYVSKRCLPDGSWQIQVEWTNYQISEEYYMNEIKPNFSTIINAPNISNPRDEIFTQERHTSSSTFNQVLEEQPTTLITTESDHDHQDDSDDQDFLERTQSRRKRPSSSLVKRAYRSPSKKSSSSTSNSAVNASQVGPQRVKWHQSYLGALAFACLKAKTWMIRDANYLDVTVESDKKKVGGIVYDWDILWIGLKVMFNDLKNYQHGVHSARRFLKNHPMIRDNITEWRRVRSTKDDEIKKLFGIEHVASQLELDDFMNRYKEWEDVDERELVEARTALFARLDKGFRIE
ncbi:aroB [Acrasis kona]|uniref:AroB n=1 Tax=Acrasis kona TaxID=1008807 RepID=A0AAW2ZBF8_9EUKA